MKLPKNPNRIIYVPLEPLQERYTVQLSAPQTGWLESRWVQNGIPYLRIEGKRLTDDIKHGSVLDANGRGYWACSQIMEILRLLDFGFITSEDVIYFDDFWHPGIEALAYSFAVRQAWVPMYAMLHAQSVDQFDFTYPMRHWMRHFEIGIGKVLSGIFVTSTCLRDLVCYAGIGNQFETQVHIAGLPYNSDEVKTHWPKILPTKKPQVVFSSRWDKEKCPLLFLRIVDGVEKIAPDIKFVITTSAKKLRSNEPLLIAALETFLTTHKNLEVREGQTKEQYYHTLLESQMQINTADQDFVSWTLLEATTCGCEPLYPYYLSFPEALNHNHLLMYPKGDWQEAAHQIVKKIRVTNQIFDPYRNAFDWVYKKYDQSWERMLNAMNGETYDTLY
jgi:glycosyltransferase involved in cell wall biosynthesis